MTTAQPRTGLDAKQRKMIAGGAIGTLMEYYDYYLYGLASAAVFPAVFFSGDSPSSPSCRRSPRSRSASSCARSAASSSGRSATAWAARSP